MGNADRIIRLFLVVLIGIFYFSGKITGTVGTLLSALGVIFLLTSLIGTCPLYIPLGISTRKRK